MSATKLFATAAVAAMAGISSGQSTVTTTVWFPDIPDSPGLWASVIDANPTATTFSLNCIWPGRKPDDGCSDMPFVTYTVGPSTANLVYSKTTYPDATRGHDCRIINSATADCAFILGGRGAEMVAQTGSWRDEPSDYTTGIDFTMHSIPLTITAGLEKLAGGAEASPTGVPATTSTGTGLVAVKETGAATTGSNTSGVVAQETGSAGTTPQDSGACSALGGRGGAIVLGVAAAIGLCMF